MTIRLAILQRPERALSALCGQLGERGYAFYEDDDPERVFHLVGATEIDILLIDAAAEYGLALLRAIKEAPALRDLPVVVVVAGDPAATAHQALALGADDLLVMPLNEIELHGRIRMLARLRSMQQERARRQAILSAFGDRKGGDPPAVPALDRTAILLFGPAGGSQVQVMSALGGAATAAYAETAELALERLRRADIDVVVITARHDLDAIAAFCRTVREDRRFADLPILWLAEAALLSEADEPVGWGASDVLLQPVHPELLRLRLKSWVRLQRLRRELQGGLGAAGGAVAIDRLTGLYGHSFLHCYLDRQIGSPRPPGRTLAVITVAPVAMDRINRTIGYPGGDRFLIELGKTISQSCRSEDLTCRYGGDRFCVVLGSIRGKDGRAVARRIGRALEQADWNGADLAPREPMFHLGFAERQAEDDAISLLRRAFQARLNAGLRAVS